MNIAIDVSPLESGHFLQHRVRGTGFYVTNLKNSLLEYYPDNNYVFFNRGDKLPSVTDIIHIPYFEPFFLTLPFKKKYKSVVTVHDLTPLVFPQYFPKGIKGNIKWEIQKNLLKNCDAIIADSISSKKDICKFVGISENKVHVVYLAAGKEYKKISSSQTLLQIKKKYHLPDEFLLYVGDVTWNKNVPSIIKASLRTDLMLIMVGKAIKDPNFDKNNPWNSDLKETQELVSKNYDKIKVLDFIPINDLVSVYNLATCLLMPSFYEGFGLPILEAMSCGCPVITSECGSLPEVAGNAAIYVDPENEEAIVGGIKTVMENKDLWKKLSFAGTEQARTFSWQKTAQETMSIYEKVY